MNKGTQYPWTTAACALGALLISYFIYDIMTRPEIPVAEQVFVKHHPDAQITIVTTENIPKEECSLQQVIVAHDKTVRDWQQANPEMKIITIKPLGEELACKKEAAPETVEIVYEPK